MMWFGITHILHSVSPSLPYTYILVHALTGSAIRETLHTLANVSRLLLLRYFNKTLPRGAHFIQTKLKHIFNWLFKSTFAGTAYTVGVGKHKKYSSGSAWIQNFFLDRDPEFGKFKAGSWSRSRKNHSGSATLELPAVTNTFGQKKHIINFFRNINVE